MRTFSKWLLPWVALFACGLAGVAYIGDAWGGGMVQQQALPPSQDDVAALAWSLFLQNWWCAFGGLGGMLYGYYRINFVNRDRRNWQWRFRMEVAGVAAAFTAFLMTAFVQAGWYPKTVAIFCVAPITGMATPPAYDFIWRPFLWPLLKGLARAGAKGAVKTMEATGGAVDEDSTIVKFAKGKDKEK